MKTVHYCIIAILLFMVGCTPVRYFKQNPTVQHQYELSVVDVDGNPLEGVKIEYTLKNWNKVVESDSYTTASDGFLKKNIIINKRLSYPKEYRSEFHFKATKDGYYPKTGKLSSNYGKKYPFDKEVEKDKIILIRPIDYFNKEFASTISDADLKIKVLSFIDSIILQGFVAESVLEPRSINLISFKDNNYLQFKFTNINEYNSLKHDKFDIGKILFDEVIRKILSLLNDYIGNSDLFYGYDLTVVGHTMNFAEQHSTAKPIVYRFLMPENVVRKYKNKEILRQKLLDKSVIHMDDELIELKLYEVIEMKSQ